MDGRVNAGETAKRATGGGREAAGMPGAVGLSLCWLGMFAWGHGWGFIGISDEGGENLTG